MVTSYAKQEPHQLHLTIRIWHPDGFRLSKSNDAIGFPVFNPFVDSVVDEKSQAVFQLCIANACRITHSVILYVDYLVHIYVTEQSNLQASSHLPAMHEDGEWAFICLRMLPPHSAILL